jgi:hypothetical protein
MEAKDLAYTRGSTILSGVSLSVAQDAKTKLEASGATVQIRNAAAVIAGQVPKEETTANARRVVTEQWEYLTQFVNARIDNQDVKKKRPNPKSIAKLSPKTMIPELNALGADGWELVHMQPVLIGENSDIKTDTEARLFTHGYFCVFKRRK